MEKERFLLVDGIRGLAVNVCGMAISLITWIAVPWIFLFLTGYFCSFSAPKSALWNKIAYRKIPLLSAIGPKSIWIYLVHQPVCMLVSMLLFA